MRFATFKFLFLIIMLNSAAFAQVSQQGDGKFARDSSVNAYEQFAESLRKSVDKDFSLTTIIIFVLSITLLITAVVFYEIHRSNKIRNELLELAWKKFDYNVRRFNLNQSGTDLLKEIALESGLQDPDSMIKSPQVFEKSLEKYYKGKKIESMPMEKLKDIRGMRKVLGFLPLSREIPFISTRQFDSGGKCIVQIPESGQATHKGMCMILSVGESQWAIARPEGPQVPTGTWIRLNMTRPGDAEYVFRAQMLNDSKGALTLSHATQLNRTQQRNWVRINVSIPVEVGQVENGVIGDIFFGKIIDMSGGGLGMALPVKLLHGTELRLSFELPDHGRIDKLPVKVVRVSDFVHSVAFEGEKGEYHQIQEQIIQYIFEKQRQDSLIKHS